MLGWLGFIGYLAGLAVSLKFWGMALLLGYHYAMQSPPDSWIDILFLGLIFVYDGYFDALLGATLLQTVSLHLVFRCQRPELPIGSRALIGIIVPNVVVLLAPLPIIVMGCLVVGGLFERYWLLYAAAVIATFAIIRILWPKLVLDGLVYDDSRNAAGKAWGRASTERLS